MDLKKTHSSLWLVSYMVFYFWSGFHLNVNDLLSSIIGILIAMLPFFKWFKKLEVPSLIVHWLLFFTGTSILLGTLIGFYDLFFWWDKYLHLTSGTLFGFIGVFILVFSQNKAMYKTTLFNKCFIIFSFPLAIGVVWEIFEYSMDTFTGTNLQRTGLPDTMSDLIFATIGAFIAIIIYLYLYNQRKESLIITKKPL